MGSFIFFFYVYDKVFLIAIVLVAVALTFVNEVVFIISIRVDEVFFYGFFEEFFVVFIVVYIIVFFWL